MGGWVGDAERVRKRRGRAESEGMERERYIRFQLPYRVKVVAARSDGAHRPWRMEHGPTAQRMRKRWEQRCESAAKKEMKKKNVNLVGNLHIYVRDVNLDLDSL